MGHGHSDQTKSELHWEERRERTASAERPGHLAGAGTLGSAAEAEVGLAVGVLAALVLKEAKPAVKEVSCIIIL